MASHRLSGSLWSCESNPLQKVLDFLGELQSHSIAYTVDSVRDAIMVSVAVPGERWEVEFFADGHVEVERFPSAGDIEGEEALKRLIDAFGD